MGWKNSGLAFCAATETIADVANTAITSYTPQAQHHLDARAAAMYFRSIPQPSISSTYKLQTDHLLRSPLLKRSSPRRLQAVDVFVDDFIAVAQGAPTHLSRVRRALFHAIDKVFRPVEVGDNPHRKEPISKKKLDKGDCSWDLIKFLLRWEVNTVTQTIHLPHHRVERLKEILALFPFNKKCTTVKVWQIFIGKLRSMAIAIPAARGMFSQMKYALTKRLSPNRIAST